MIQGTITPGSVSLPTCQVEAHKAKLRAIEKVETAAAVREAALTDAQDVAEIVLEAEARLGAMLSKSSSKGTFKKAGEKALPQGIDKKMSHQAQQIHNH